LLTAERSAGDWSSARMLSQSSSWPRTL
jgi:hypothetical protein